METLLDRHSATFDTWLHTRLMPLNATSRPHYYLAVVTLLDQLNPKQFDWHHVSMILQHQLSVTVLDTLLPLFGGMGFKSNIEFTRIVSKFLMDRDRAGPLWVNSHNHADLGTSVVRLIPRNFP
jgi:hypothetical protein